MKTIVRQRIALSAIFFQTGLVFSTWASRIPDIKDHFLLDEAALGSLLLIKPIGSMAGLPLAGWIVDRFGSRAAVVVALCVYSSCLILIALSPNLYALGASLLLFGISGNLANVSLNTQALDLQTKFGRVVLASFHGLWSLAGFCGAALGAFALAINLDVMVHFASLSALMIALTFFNVSFLDEGKSQHPASGFVLLKPSPTLLRLGAIAFFGMMSEGCMFDWSGVYFRQVIGAQDGMVAAGFMAFMAMMATVRFVSDYFTNRFGVGWVLRMSGLLIFGGLLLAVIFPFFVTGIIGFLMVGAGTSSVIPLTFSEVGKTGGVSTGKALAMVATLGYFGFLFGPPLIGFIAELFSLRYSFALVAIAGLVITLLHLQPVYRRGPNKGNAPIYPDEG